MWNSDKHFLSCCTICSLVLCLSIMFIFGYSYMSLVQERNQLKADLERVTIEKALLDFTNNHPGVMK